MNIIWLQNKKAQKQIRASAEKITKIFSLSHRSMNAELIQSIDTVEPLRRIAYRMKSHRQGWRMVRSFSPCFRIFRIVVDDEIELNGVKIWIDLGKTILVLRHQIFHSSDARLTLNAIWLRQLITFRCLLILQRAPLGEEISDWKLRKTLKLLDEPIVCHDPFD